MGEKETMSGDALRESPTRASQGRESSAPSVSEGVTAPRDVATGQSSGRMENIGSSGMDTGQDASAAPNLGSSGQERSGISGDPVPDIDAGAAIANWDLATTKK